MDNSIGNGKGKSVLQEQYLDPKQTEANVMAEGCEITRGGRKSNKHHRSHSRSLSKGDDAWRRTGTKKSVFSSCSLCSVFPSYFYHPISLDSPVRTRVRVAFEGASGSSRGVRTCAKGQNRDMQRSPTTIQLPPSLDPYRRDKAFSDSTESRHSSNAHLVGSGSLSSHLGAENPSPDVSASSSLPPDSGCGLFPDADSYSSIRSSRVPTSAGVAALHSSADARAAPGNPRRATTGKELWGHLDGSSPAPTDPHELSIWTTKDAKIVSWILGSVKPHMINNLRSFGTGKEIWDYFRRIYSQNNSAKKFQVEMGIANYKQEFEAVRASLINRSSVPTLDECLGELLREEQRLATQHELTQDTVTEMSNRQGFTVQSKLGLLLWLLQPCLHHRHRNLHRQRALRRALSLPRWAADDNICLLYSWDFCSENGLCNMRKYMGNQHIQDQVLGKVIVKGPKMGRLFPIQFSIPSINSCAYSTLIHNPYFWHKKLGHPNSNVLTHLMKHGNFGNKNSFSTEFLDCSSCKLGKSKALSFPSHGSRASECFEIIHTDVWGISPVISHAQYKYFVTFIDDFSRFTWIYFLRSKADVFSTFQAFVVFVEYQFSAHIKILRSNSRGEYMSKEFQEYLKNKGILSQRSCPYTPQQNVVAEHKNRVLLDVVRTLLIDSSIPTRFWVEALSTAVHLINHLPSQVLNFASPYSILFGVIPEYNSLHVFGCVCFVHLPSTERNKLLAQATRCAFLGYSHSHKGFVCYDANAHKIRISSNVILFENQNFFSSCPSTESTPIQLPTFDDDSPSYIFERFKPRIVYQRRHPPSTLPLPDTEPTSDHTPQLRRSTRVSRAPNRYGYSATTIDSTFVPKTYAQASTQDCWQQAMKEELQALQDNHT
ncbi:hypothetical protein NC653_026695 [Populus alba x Populus x berolinensis]|uniref:Integrase catalytic domain-containing protein n=1 Tax=Populus alba x Populus x berolinensis TaxID=444605 RepID=A0AAD6Q598_9ROSI|nr:hypothetical protein NC653_026695 [Populus alba x Populus x berolinensis]